MVHEYSTNKITDSEHKTMSKPRTSTLNFIRQFARSYVKVNGCALGTMVLN